MRLPPLGYIIVEKNSIKIVIVKDGKVIENEIKANDQQKNGICISGYV